MGDSFTGQKTQPTVSTVLKEKRYKGKTRKSKQYKIQQHHKKTHI